MSGYLQRLAAGAARAETRVRPFLGSIFAEGPRERRDDPMHPVMTQRTVEPSRQGFEEHSVEAKPALPRRDDATFASMQPAQPVVMESRPAYTPLLPRAGAMAEMPETFTARTVRSESAAPENSSKLEAAAPANPQAQPMQALVREARHENKEGETREGRTVVQSPLRVAAPPARRQPQERRAEVPAPERGEGQPVQVHIGRIEVIAVPPAAARIPIRQSRATSLDDYLRRGNGRAR